MASVKTWKLSKEFQPAAVGTDETKVLFGVAAGVRVISASYRVLIASAASSAVTMTLGDGDDPDGYIAAFDPETATSASGAGAYFATSGGKLYTAADTIDVVYDQTTPGATNPKVLFTVTFQREWP